MITPPRPSQEWKEIPASDYCESVRDGTHDSPKFAGEGFPLVTSKHIKDGLILTDEASLISRVDFEQINRRSKVDTWDVLITMIGTVGDVAVVRDDPPLYAVKNLGLFKTKCELDGRWLYYWLKSPQAKGLIFQRLAGASQQYLTLGHLRAFPVRTPVEVEIKKRIVDVLQSYDDLIENNRRRIKLLEEAARLIFREWFVRLRFPGHEHTGIENGLPEGWHQASIADLTEFLSRGISPSYDDEAPGLVINQKCIRNGLLDLGPARRQSKKVPTSKLVLAGDVLVNSTGAGTLGRVAQVLEEIPDCTVDSHVTIVRPRMDLSPAWFGMALVSMQPVIEGMGKGATNQTELSKADLGELKLTVPSKSVSDDFDQLVSPLRRQVQVLRNQCKALQKARDLLLPRLMSGEIEV